MFRLLSSKGKQSPSIVVSKMPTQPFEAQRLITQSASSCVMLLSSLYFFSSLSFIASYLVHQCTEEKGKHIHFSQEKTMTFHIQFFLDVNLGS